MSISPIDFPVASSINDTDVLWLMAGIASDRDYQVAMSLLKTYINTDVNVTNDLGINIGAVTELLHVHETSSSAARAQFTNTTTGTASNNGFIIGLNADESVSLKNQVNSNLDFWTNNAQRAVIDNNGDVGIGINSPLTKLHLHDESSDAVQIAFTNSDTESSENNGFHIGIDENEKAVLWNYETSDMRFGIANTEFFQISKEGNAGLITDKEIDNTVTSGPFFALGDADTGIGQDGTDKLELVTGGTTRLIINGSNDAGVGCANLESWISTFSTLKVGGNATLYSSTTKGAGAKFGLVVNGYFNSTSTWKYISTDVASLLTLTDGQIIGWNAVSGTAGNTISWSPRFHIKKNGLVEITGLGTGDVYHTAGSGFYISSARKLKENIKPIKNALDIVTQLQGVYFDWKDKRSEKTEIGFIADDVFKIIPEATGLTADGKDHTMFYGRVTALLTEAFKELNNKINKLEIKYAKYAK
jgi:hypothetical protein